MYFLRTRVKDWLNSVKDIYYNTVAPPVGELSLRFTQLVGEDVCTSLLVDVGLFICLFVLSKKGNPQLKHCV